MPQIDYLNITKEYDQGLKALDDVSLKVESGEFVFIVGPSGAGKSTLVRLLIREESPSSGDILFNEQSVLTLPHDKIHELRRRIGVVFQDLKLLESKSVFENVAIALDVVDTMDKDIRNIVPSVLSLVGLSDKVDKFPKQLSGGEKQRLSIARALAHEPDVLIADEATGMIDPDSADDVVEVLEKINSLGTTVIMATHDERIVDKLKRRVVRIEKGKIISDKKGGKYRV